MWLMTTRGFYSAVQHRENPSQLLIRTRTEEDIRALKDLLPDAEPWRLDDSDYEWRLECSVAEWMSAVASMVCDIDYANFKNAVKDPAHKKAYMACWSALHKLQPWRPWTTVKDRDTDGKCRVCNRKLGMWHTLDCTIADDRVLAIDCTKLVKKPKPKPKKAKARKAKKNQPKGAK